ncbi:MurR/RpiR family transcriptional regulator [Clostridium sp.]|uniref:MurR/RpiR family transcriptional regulator n=1 Tax=Clostridium sp. TaxID=1506 RepID=UPI002FCB611C
MKTDFFEFVNNKISTLNKTEKKIFDYIVKNMCTVKGMSIRKLSKECYVSTTTMFRFVKKLGFTGYNEFISTLRITESTPNKAVIPKVIKTKNYKEEYLKNIIESVRVMSNENSDKFISLLKDKPKIYIFGHGLTFQVVGYIHYLFISMGYETIIVNRDYENKMIVEKITPADVVMILSYSGENDETIKNLESIRLKNNNIVSITRADNNIIQSLSDINFYIFSDNIAGIENDISSRISMIAIIETLLYKII